MRLLSWVVLALAFSATARADDQQLRQGPNPSVVTPARPNEAPQPVRRYSYVPQQTLRPVRNPQPTAGFWSANHKILGY